MIETPQDHYGGPEEPDEEQHPGWRTLAEIFEESDPLFPNIIFMEGCEYSSNIYVMTGDYLTIVDPGNDFEAFEELFARPDFDPADIGKIVLTHGHQAHSMGAMGLFRYPAVRENPQLEILIHEACPVEFKRLLGQFGRNAIELKGYEKLELSGSEWEVIHTPGHTIDGICLYHELSGTVFSGDTVMPHAAGKPDKNGSRLIDHYLHGLRRLLRRGINHVLPGHGLPVAATGRQIVEASYEAVMRKVTGEDPESPFFNMAAILAQHGLAEEAIYCCDKQLLLKPDDYRSWKLKALCLNDVGRFKEAIAALEKVKDLMGIEPFRAESLGRFKEEIEEKVQRRGE